MTPRVSQNSRGRCQRQPAYNFLMDACGSWDRVQTPSQACKGPSSGPVCPQSSAPLCALTFWWLSVLLKGSEPLHMPISLLETPLLILQVEDSIQGSPLAVRASRLLPEAWLVSCCFVWGSWVEPAFPALFGNIFLICLPSRL